MTRDWVDLRIAATASLSGSAVRATMATSAPEAANRAATARPIPLLPPVTIAARRERLISIASSQTRLSAVPHSKASEQGYFGRSLLVPYPDAPSMLFSESGSNQLAQYSGLSKLLASELGHPYGLNHEIPPLGEAQISYSLYDAAVTPCQADRLIANYADHVKPIAIMLRWQGLRIGEALRADWLHLNRRAHLRCTKRPARRCISCGCSVGHRKRARYS